MIKANMSKGVSSDDNNNKFESIYQQYNRAVYANILNIVQDKTLAQDLFQETFLALWDHLEHKAEKFSYASWLFVVSHNKAKYCLKAKLKDSLVFIEDYQLVEKGDEPITDASLIDTQLELISNAVDHLSPRRKKAFTLHKFEGKSVEEIAAEMNATPGTIREYLKQSVRLIRDEVMKDKAVVQGAALLLCMMLH